MRMEDEKDKNGQGNPGEIEKDVSSTIKKEPPVFMDTIAYIAIYNDDYDVIDIINHTQNDISDEKIKEIAENILKQENNKTMKIGNLYFDRYSYSYKGHNSLTIIDNITAQTKVVSLLKTSIIIFTLLEMIIIVVALRITDWIIKPVVESFNKQKQFIVDASHH